MRNKRLEGSSGGSELFASLVVILVFGLGSCAYSSVSCESRWEHSNMASTWGPIKGCLVKLPDGRWLPEDRVREIDIPKQ